MNEEFVRHSRRRRRRRHRLDQKDLSRVYQPSTVIKTHTKFFDENILTLST